MNLPNSLTVARIVASPVVALLPFASSWGLRLVGSGWAAGFLSPHRTPLVARVLGPMLREGTERGLAFPFATPFGPAGLPWWVLAVVLGRELFMTVFRQAAARRGVVIAAIGPAKWKTGFQWTWCGAAFFWFGAITAAMHFQWLGHPLWRAFAFFNGVVGTVTMV